MADDETPNIFYGIIVVGAAGFISWIGWEMLNQIDSLTVSTESAALSIAFFIGVTVYAMFY